MSKRIDTALPTRRRSPSGGEWGFSMIEVLIALTVLGVSMLALGGTVLTNVRNTAGIDRSARVRDQALNYVERLQRLPFGEPSDPPAPGESLDLLFRDGAGLPALTLFQVRRPVEGDGRRFRLAGFEADGEWEIRVNEDADGNGAVDEREATFDLFRIEILFDRRPVLRTFRARRVEID